MRFGALGLKGSDLLGFDAKGAVYLGEPVAGRFFAAEKPALSVEVHCIGTISGL